MSHSLSRPPPSPILHLSPQARLFDSSDVALDEHITLASWKLPATVDDASADAELTAISKEALKSASAFATISFLLAKQRNGN